jgi:hypothetical protein
MSLKIVRLSSLLFAFVLAASAFCFDSSALAGSATGQNANSSTTIENANAAKPSGRRGRGGRRPAAAATAETPATPAAESQEMTTAATEPTDLSGTYTGTLDCPDAGVSGETTLTITGNQFTLTDGKTGRITAATTRGYTGVAMQFGELTPGTVAQPGTAPVIVSMRAKKSGDRLTLMTVPGATRVCSFTPAGVARARTRRKRAPAATPATPAEPMVMPATPAEPATAPDSAGPTPPATPTPRRRGRKRPQ